ncbi:metal ABC transporter permease [Rubritalea spongiae]|uniref:Metal ABC transporter permease n=1 Tax=Rubritalea spongiae TaxID=430797 RepID=A0ABW5E380_9BACT
MPWAYFGMGAVWLTLMCFFVALPCSQLGTFLVLRRMSLVGDAISHSVLPGIVIAFLFVGDLASPWLLIGAALAGLLVTVLIEQIHQRTRIKQDSAIGIAFTSLFALGVVLMALFLDKVHLDQQCVLEGALGDILHYDTVGVLGLEVPSPVVTMFVVAIATLCVVVLFYRVLMLSSFDAGLAASFGYKPGVVHYALMAFLSVVVVAAFQAVGAILVIALLILPAATAYLCTHSLKKMLLIAGLHALISSVAGIYIHVWTDGSQAAAVVVAGLGLFILAWLFGPADGVVLKALQRRSAKPMELQNEAS